MIKFSDTRSIDGRDYVPLDEVLAYIEGLKGNQKSIGGAINKLSQTIKDSMNKKQKGGLILG